MRIKLSCMLTSILLFISTALYAEQIEWVLVDDPNNEPDETGFGSVNYEYLISRYEITNQQYCEFLNAVAKDDTYALYNPDMNSHLNGGIERYGEKSDYYYSYGTFDQNGNVFEWTETRFNKAQWCIRGGSFDVSHRAMKASVRERNSVLYLEGWSFGFRIAALPED